MQTISNQVAPRCVDCDKPSFTAHASRSSGEEVVASQIDAGVQVAQFLFLS